ncbi:hypothetical protein [Mesorhizobium sp. 14Argb]
MKLGLLALRWNYRFANAPALASESVSQLLIVTGPTLLIVIERVLVTNIADDCLLDQEPRPSILDAQTDPG